MSSKMSLGAAIGIDAALAYALVVLAVLALPETRGKRLSGGMPQPKHNADGATKAQIG
jgi:hypothetical protein